MNLADPAILRFAAELTVARTYKAVLKNGEEMEPMKIDLMRTYPGSAIWGDERISRVLAG